VKELSKIMSLRSNRILYRAIVLPCGCRAIAYNGIVVSCLLLGVFIDLVNIGVACGPGCTFQVLASPARNPYLRCGLSTAIPNVGLRTIAVKPQEYILIRHHDFPCVSLVITRMACFVFTKNVFHLIKACVLKRAMSRTIAPPIPFNP
jgi:hypothetical protein